MPTPFMCHSCDKPTMNESGVCDTCYKKEPIFKQDVVYTITAMLDNWEKEYFSRIREESKRNERIQ